MLIRKGTEFQPLGGFLVDLTLTITTNVRTVTLFIDPG